MEHQHLPYEIDPSKNRSHFYEGLWKQRGLELLTKHVTPAGQTVLDYGCGRGEAIELFNRAGFRVTGADADPECVRLASARGEAKELNVADPLGQFGEKSFDIVVCFHVLEHVDNPKDVLRSLAKIARRYVLVAVPNLRNLIWFFKRGSDIRKESINEGHLHGWDHWHFLNLAERHCGLRLVEWTHDATILPVFNRFVQPIFGMKAAIWLETRVFRRLLPFWGISVIGLFKPGTDADQT
jgi:SAM-dependent methyltransferase